MSSPKTGPSAIALVLALVAAGCGHTIIDKPVTRQGDSWDLILRKLTDGPNQYGTAGRTYYPGEGSRFIWAHITLHNNQPVARKFNFDRCGLDDGDSQVVPAKIDIDAIITGEVNREPELSPDETITRKLIFVYPENRSPTQLTCLPMVIPLPQF